MFSTSNYKQTGQVENRLSLSTYKRFTSAKTKNDETDSSENKSNERGNYKIKRRVGCALVRDKI